MSALDFRITAQDPRSKARAGLLTVKHGAVRTPDFIVVGTRASVKAVHPDDLKRIGVQITLANTYHLWLRPGEDTVAGQGGLHRFMGWDGPMVTDSGGFQAFSLGYALEHGVGKLLEDFGGDPGSGKRKPSRPRLARIDEDGVLFRSHLDGAPLRLTPEKSIDIQQKLGADIILALDECTSPMSDYGYTREALERTHRWAERSLAARTDPGLAIAGIVQGGEYDDLRRKSAEFMAAMPFDSYAIGGSLGKSKADMYRVIEVTDSILPDGKPRHLLGIGSVDDIFNAVERGVDLFDCILPTRMARLGTVFIRPESGGRPSNNWRMRVNASMSDDSGPLDAACQCPACGRFSRSYLRHLLRSKDPLYASLASVHNIAFMTRLMEEIRSAIAAGRFGELKRDWLGH